MTNKKNIQRIFYEKKTQQITGEVNHRPNKYLGRSRWIHQVISAEGFVYEKWLPYVIPSGNLT